MRYSWRKQTSFSNDKSDIYWFNLLKESPVSQAPRRYRDETNNWVGIEWKMHEGNTWNGNQSQSKLTSPAYC